jgi:hypothetical protein
MSPAPIPDTFGVFPGWKLTLLVDCVVKMKFRLVTWRGLPGVFPTFVRTSPWHLNPKPQTLKSKP